MIDIDSEFQSSTQLYSYDRGQGEKMCVFAGVDPGMRRVTQITLDTSITRFQTVVLLKTATSEIVLELRPRRLTEMEKAKLGAK